MQLAHEKNQHQETNKLKPFNGDVSSPLFAPETNAVGFLITAAISSCQKIQWNCSFSGIIRTYFLFWSCFFSCCVWLLFVRQYIDRQMMSLLLLCGKPSHWRKCVTEAGIHILPYEFTTLQYIDSHYYFHCRVSVWHCMLTKRCLHQIHVFILLPFWFKSALCIYLCFIHRQIRGIYTYTKPKKRFVSVVASPSTFIRASNSFLQRSFIYFDVN